MSRLLEVLSLLRTLAITDPKIISPEAPRFLNLVNTLNHDRAVKPRKPRPNVLPKWNAVIESGNLSEITLPELRALFWEKEVALSNQFIKHLFQRKVNIRRSSIKGFVFAIASRWDEVLEGKLPLTLFEYGTYLTQLSKSEFLNQVSPFILHPEGHNRFADHVIKRKLPLSEMFSEVFGIVIPTSQYTSHVLSLISEKSYSIALSDTRKDREWFYDSILRHLGKKHLVACLGKIVQEIENSKAEEAKEELKGFILKHPNLGDPRLPNFESNWDKGDPATQAVIEWLSQSDINFFFELFFEERKDVQGRKKFWLPYAHLIRGTRVIISQADKSRLQAKLMDLYSKEKFSRNIFADLKGQGKKATAFIMDFGSIKVVEFSLSDNACYYYDSKSEFRFNDRTLFWDTKSFSESELKDTLKCPKPLSHFKGWESTFATLLARHGVRPKSKGHGYY